MSKKTILVAGGAGFIGSHTSVELINQGYEVVIVDNFSNSDKKVISGISEIVGFDIIYYEVDCCDEVSLKAIFEKHQFDAVIHFAAFKAVGESVKEPLKYLQNNLNSLMTIISLMREFDTKHLIFSSSCTVYGQPDKLPVTESTPRKSAESPYGYTKQVSEDIIEQCTAAYENFSAIALRYFNPIGAHPSGLIGELPIGIPANLIPYITQTAAGIRDELNIFGDDYNTPDGSAIRDYIDIIDLSKAHVAAANRMINKKTKKDYEVYNVGVGTGLSVLEIVNEFKKATGIKIPHKIIKRREGDIEQIWADTTLSNNELEWKAERKIGDTLLSAWVWQKNNT